MSKKMMTRTPVQSSNIASIGYDSGTLDIEFKDGAIYQYSDVPAAVHKALMQAPSIGSYFAKNIKGSYRHKPL